MVVATPISFQHQGALVARKRNLTPRQAQLAAKREQVKHARRLVMRKVKRVQNTLGVTPPEGNSHYLGKHTPRIPSLRNIDRYTEKQLDSYLKEAASFRQRNVQFEALGRPEANMIVTRERWKQFDRVQQQRRKQAKTAFESIEDIMIDHLGQTIGERAEMLRAPRRRQMENNTGNLAEPKTSQQITSEKAMDELERKMRRYNEGGEHSVTRQQAMKSLEAMDQVYTAAGDPGLVSQIKELTDDQFYALWNVRDFANAAASYYQILKQLDNDTMSADKIGMWEDAARQDREDMQGLIDSVKKIQGTGRRF